MEKEGCQLKETFTFPKLPEIPSASLPVDKNEENMNNQKLPEMPVCQLIIRRIK